MEEEEESVNFKQILITGFIIIIGLVGSLVAVYLLFWAWSMYGFLSLALLAAAILGIITIFFIYDLLKKRRTVAPSNRLDSCQT